jgi:hypothetical protein
MKCEKSKYAPNSLRGGEQMIRARILYSFRKDTLENLQKDLDRLLENLQIGLQALQL